MHGLDLFLIWINAAFWLWALPNHGGWHPEGRPPMTVRSDNKDHSLTDNLWVELSLLAVVTLILIVLAWGYVW